MSAFLATPRIAFSSLGGSLRPPTPGNPAPVRSAAPPGQQTPENPVPVRQPALSRPGYRSPSDENAVRGPALSGFFCASTHRRLEIRPRLSRTQSQISLFICLFVCLLCYDRASTQGEDHASRRIHYRIHHWGHFRKRITAYVKQAALAVAA